MAVPGPGAGGAWITFNTTDFIPTGLPGYRAPYNDFLRAALKENGRFSALVIAAIDVAVQEVGDQYFKRASIGIGLQPALDVLPALAAMTLGIPIASPTITLAQPDTDMMQAWLLGLLPDSRTFLSGANEPFEIAFTYAPGYIFEAVPCVFTGEVEGQSPEGFEFMWRFTDYSGARDDPSTTTTTTLTGPVVAHTFAAGVNESDVMLSVTAPGGEVSRRATSVTVSDSLWNLLWQAHTLMNGNPDVRLGSLALELAKYRLAYDVTAGTPTSVAVSYLGQHDAQFRCFGPARRGQGEIELRIPLRLHSEAVSLRGALGWLDPAVVIRSVDVTLHLSKRYTPCVLTSDRRSIDPLKGVSYRTAGGGNSWQDSQPFDVETVQGKVTFDTGGYDAEVGPAALPAALAAKPLREHLKVAVDKVDADVVLSGAAKTVGYVIGLLVTLGLAGVAAVIVIAVLLTMLEDGPGIIALPATLVLLAALIIIFGLEILLIEVIAPRLLSDYTRDHIRRYLERNADAMGTAMDDQGLVRYVGEGVAEAIALRVIKEAVSQGHPVPPFDPTTELGRARFRPHLFETIFVSEGQCKVRIRV